jgi:uncharacterized protein YgiM (DUF1202 family)
MPAVAPRWLDYVALIMLLAMLALPVTYLEITRPSWHQIQTASNGLVKMLPQASSNNTVATTPPLPATSVTTVGGNAAPAQVKTATTNAPVNLRQAKSVNSTILMQIPSGTAVQLGSNADTTWQGVTYQGKTGYIYRAYLTY